MDKAPVRMAADAVQRARARTLQVKDRIGEVRERTQWMTRDGGDSMTVEEWADKGSTPEQAARAAQYARLAKERAAEAAERRVTAHEHAALAHDHAAKRWRRRPPRGWPIAFPTAKGPAGTGPLRRRKEKLPRRSAGLR